MTNSIAMQQHFVTFASPGTFVPEQTTKPIDAWDVEVALKMAGDIVERYNARPYCFYFSTRGRTASELDSKQIAESPLYYFGVQVLTREQIEARNDPDESILLTNMRNNDVEAVVRTKKGWQATLPLRKGDVVLDAELP